MERAQINEAAWMQRTQQGMATVALPVVLVGEMFLIRRQCITRHHAQGDALAVAHGVTVDERQRTALDFNSCGAATSARP